MSTVTGTTPTPTATTTTSTSKPSFNKDQQNFLKLFTDELKNQDPTSPTDISTYYSTINQYYSLQQQVNTNDTLARIESYLKTASNTTTPTPTSTTSA